MRNAQSCFEQTKLVFDFGKIKISDFYFNSQF